MSESASRLPGLHHVTAIAGDPQRNVDFYAGLLGLRLVKVTVNFDDPETYHLYYGDGSGTPGSIVTFFPWPHAPRARAGAGAVTALAFSVPRESLPWWGERLRAAGVAAADQEERMGETVLACADPDGLAIELAGGDDRRPPWSDGPVAGAYAIRGLHSVTLQESAVDPTATLLVGTMGFRRLEAQDARTRFVTGGGAPGEIIDLVAAPAARRGGMGRGVVHHAAWRTPDDAAQLRLQQELLREGYHVSPVMDRQYFRSIYYREPGGALFEIATDPPGFATDEEPATLGQSLRLPPWLEPGRDRLRAKLPALRTPQGVNLP